MSPLRLIPLLVLLASGIAASAAPVNIALLRPVEVDSRRDANTPGWAAVDGDATTNSRRWVSSLDPMPHWIEVYPDGHYSVSRLRFWTGADEALGHPVTAFELQSWNGEQWQTLHAESAYANSGAVDISFLPELASDRLRMLFTDGEDSRVRLYELEIHGEAHPLQVAERHPLGGAAVVDPATPVWVDFNIPVDLAEPSGIRMVRLSDGTTIGSGTVSATGARVSLVPPPLQYGETYQVILPAGAVTSATDPQLANAPVFWDFTVLPAEPLVAAHSRTTGPADPLRVRFDRPVTLLDPGPVALRNLDSGEAIPVDSLSVSGAELVIAHGGLPQRHRLMIELPAATLASVDTAAANARVALSVYVGDWEILPTTSFVSGLEGFHTGFSEGQVPDDARRWDWLARSPQSWTGLNAGPGEDFTWIGTNRAYAGDFAATPALPLEAGEEYTLSFLYSLINGNLRVDLRDAPVRDEDAPQAGYFPMNNGASARGNVTLTAGRDGDQHFVFYGQGAHAFPWIRLDDISVVRTVRPGIHVAAPAADATFIEGAPITISGDAFGFSAELERIDVRLGERLLGTFSESPFALSLSDYDPGLQVLRVTAHDQRGESSEMQHSFTVLFEDGTLAPFVQYSFRDGLEGVSSNGSANGDYLDFNPSDGKVWLSTPRLFLQAGETYTIQFDAHRGNASDHLLFLSLEGAQGFPDDPRILAHFDVNAPEWLTYRATITVEASGPYYLSLFNDGQQNWNRVWIDNLRIVGNFNSAPTITLAAPADRTITLAGAPLTLSAFASDPDGEVTGVDFRTGELLIGSLGQPPYDWLWESAPIGELTVTAVAHDNAGGFSDPAQVRLTALENRVNISTNLGTAGANEAIRAMAYQPDGTLVIGGMIDPAFFDGITPLLLGPAQPGQQGVVARLSGDGRTVLSLAVVGAAVVDLSLDSAGNIHVAAGLDGILKLNPLADAVIWHYSPADMGVPGKLAHRVDASPGGVAAALLSPQTNYDAQTLSAGDIALVRLDGTLHPQLMSGSGGTYTNDVAVDEARERVWIAGWKNFHTFVDGGTYPVDVPIFAARSYAAATFNERLIRGYDWESTDANGRGLNRVKNNMADTRAQRVTLAPNGDIYLGLEYDGGNTPLRDDPYDLSQTVEMVGGDSHHSNEFTSTVPKVAVIRLDGESGAFKAGQYLVPRLSSGGDNTFRLVSGQLLVDAAGRVHVVGAAASGSPLSFDVLPGRYTGGGVHWVLSPDLGTREMVTRWSTSGDLHAVAVSPAGKVAVGGRITGPHPDEAAPSDQLYRRRAFLGRRLSASDALLVVGDFGHYYSFQPGNHPRLFFTADMLPELRHRATRPPYDAMLQALRDARLHNGDYLPFDPDHSYSRSMRAKINAFLYTVTGDEALAAAAREDVEWVITGTHYPWADPTLKGLNSYWMAAHVALAYDWCALSPHWDDAFLFRVSKALLDMAAVIITHGGSEQNTHPSSNWQGARGAAGGLALLATDSRHDPSLLDAAYQRVRTYVNESVGIHPDGRGWASEGIGYTLYPYGLFVGPFGEAMARLDGRDLRNETAITAVYRSLLTAPTAAINAFDHGGAKPDWTNDNIHINGEGVFGQAFYYLDAGLLPAARWIYDRLQGPLACDRARWDEGRGGTIWSFLHYPEQAPAQDPLDFHAWHSANADAHGIGISTFRNGYHDADDIIAQFKARLFAAGGHDGPDGLGFRILGMDTAWAVGGGRDEPGKRVSQATLYPVEPGALLAGTTNMNTGSLAGPPLVKVDGGGHVIAEMPLSNTGVVAHKRWFVVDYDSAATGAAATFLVADTSEDGAFWQLPTSPFNTITISGDTFTISAPGGATLRGTVLHPAGARITHGSRPRGDTFSPLYGGSLADMDPVLNPPVNENNHVTVQGGDGDFLIVMTLQPAAAAHPVPVLSAGTVADALVEVGARSFGLTVDNVLYDGVPYAHPDAQITFDPGAGTLLAGDAVQTVPYGGQPSAPAVAAPAGHVFLGWDRRFDAVTRDLTIVAVYAAVQAVPSAPSFLRGAVASGGMVTLQWYDNSIGETGFTVQESADDGGTWTSVASPPAEAVSIALADRAPDSELSYRVRAEGTAGPSDWSNILRLATPPPNHLPFFTSTPPAIAHEGALFYYYIQAEDPEDDSLTLAFTSGPEWLSLYDSGGGAGVLTGVPAGVPELVDIILTVSDGIHPPVEQVVALAINPAPVIQLEWPLATPVYLHPDHGLPVVVNVEDSLPVSLAWAIVQGPLDATISAPASALTDLYFARAGTYTARLTATDADGATARMEFAVRVDRPPVREVAEVLDFDAAVGYTSSATGFRDSAPVTETLDLDGDGVSDRRRYHPFSVSDAEGGWGAPLNPGASAALHGGRFFGGYVAERFGGTSLNFSPNPGLDAGGQISLRFSSAYPARLHGALFWLREDFKVVDPSMEVVLGGESALSIEFGDYLDVGELRWLVRANDTFFVSQRLISDTLPGRTLAGVALDTEVWAEYDPEAPIGLDFDQHQAAFDTPTAALGPLQAVGILIDADETAPNRRFQLQVRRFTVRAEIGEAVRTAPVITLEGPEPAPAGSPTPLGARVERDPSAMDAGTEWSVTYGSGTVSFDDPQAAETMISASLPGEYRLRLTAADDYFTTFRELVWQVDPAALTAMEAWRNGHFSGHVGGSSHPDAAWDADPDRDSLPNILEYAFDGHPLVAEAGIFPFAGKAVHDGRDYLVLTYRRLKDPVTAGIAYRIESSFSLMSDDWHDVSDSVPETVIDNTPITHDWVEVRMAAPLDSGQPAFLRLRILTTP